jgi:hypothetical protein
MPLFRRLLARVAQQLAADPRVQQKASEVYEREIKPRAEKAWQQAKPKLQTAGQNLAQRAEKSLTRENMEKLAAKVRARWDERERNR